MGYIEFRYKLDPGSKKFICPSCNKKRFVRYVDEHNGEYLSSDVGRCDRELSCGYHRSPNKMKRSSSYIISKKKPNDIKPSTIPFRYLKRSKCNYGNNSLINWLSTLPGWRKDIAESVARDYHIGTGRGKVENWPIFWQVDNNMKVRSGKLMKYENGHRVKNGYSQDWVHAILKRKGKFKRFELVQCFFGLHLLNDKPIGLVESEKTALIASVYFPELTWMAAGQLHGVNEYKMKPLKGKRVVFFPDIGAYELWSEKAQELNHLADIKVSDLLERNANDENKGYDLADFLINFPLAKFRLNFKTGRIYNYSPQFKY